jgi:hypothetical protein
MRSATPRFSGGKLALLVVMSIFWAGLPTWEPTSLSQMQGGISGSVLAASTGKGAYTPPAGSPERRALVEALRQKLQSLHHLEVIFEVQYLKVHQGWAWISANPRSPDGSQRYEGVSALLSTSTT